MTSNCHKTDQANHTRWEMRLHCIESHSNFPLFISMCPGWVNAPVLTVQFMATLLSFKICYQTPMFKFWMTYCSHHINDISDVQASFSSSSQCHYTSNPPLKYQIRQFAATCQTRNCESRKFPFISYNFVFRVVACSTNSKWIFVKFRFVPQNSTYQASNIHFFVQMW